MARPRLSGCFGWVLGAVCFMPRFFQKNKIGVQKWKLEKQKTPYLPGFMGGRAGSRMGSKNYCFPCFFFLISANLPAAPAINSSLALGSSAIEGMESLRLSNPCRSIFAQYAVHRLA